MASGVAAGFGGGVMSGQTWRWEILDSWVWPEINRCDAVATLEGWRRKWKPKKGVQVRLFERSVRAGGAHLPVLVLVVRRKVDR
jgi:hypothetical protein